MYPYGQHFGYGWPVPPYMAPPMYYPTTPMAPPMYYPTTPMAPPFYAPYGPIPNVVPPAAPGYAFYPTVPPQPPTPLVVSVAPTPATVSAAQTSVTEPVAAGASAVAGSNLDARHVIEYRRLFTGSRANRAAAVRSHVMRLGLCRFCLRGSHLQADCRRRARVLGVAATATGAPIDTGETICQRSRSRSRSRNGSRSSRRRSRSGSLSGSNSEHNRSLSRTPSNSDRLQNLNLENS